MGEILTYRADITRQQIQKPSKPKVVQFTSREDAYESSAGDSEDEYQEQRAKPSQSKRPSAARRRSSTDGKPAQRKRKRKEAVEFDLSELPPEQASKIRLDMQIEAILKTKKSSRRGKKKANEEVLDSFADDEVARLRETMNAAADEDQRANMEKLPALSKLKLLPEAMDTLQKASLAQSMIDNNLLEAVRRWLEPLPDRSLPALNIQREFFAILRKMEFIDGAVLKESGLGKVILFYTKCKRVTPDISRMARELVSAWSRPIIKRSASYRDKIVPVIADYGGDGEGGGSQAPARGAEKLNAIMARAKESEKHRVKRNAVSIPQRELGNYTVAPRANAGLGMGLGRGSTSVDEDVERRKKNAERLRMLTRRADKIK
ncbi:transcription factor iws1 [Lyophyllum atratum]|nr:transcription factor iws1 [Lyophyllum atratum]